LTTTTNIYAYKFLYSIIGTRWSSCLKIGGGCGLYETELVVLGDLYPTDTIWHLDRLTVYTNEELEPTKGDANSPTTTVRCRLTSTIYIMTTACQTLYIIYIAPYMDTTIYNIGGTTGV